MSIFKKLVLAFLLVSILPAGFLSYLSLESAQVTLKQSIGDNYFTLASEKANAITRIIENRIEEAQRLASHEMIVSAVKEANSHYKGLYEKEIHNSLMEIDGRWIQEKGQTEEATTILSKDLSAYLKRYVSVDPERYGEAFTVDAQGATVAMTKRLNDYYQGDEQWCVEGYSDGQGKVFLDDRGFDLSIQAFALGVVVPVMDGGQAIGVLKINFRVKDIHGIVSEGGPSSEDVRILLARSEGTVVFDTEGDPGTRVSERHMMEINNPHDRWLEHKGTNQDNITGHAPISITFMQRHLPAGAIKGVSGEIWYETTWHVFVETSKAIAFESLHHRRHVLLGIVALTMIGVAIISILFTNHLTRPILKLANDVDILGMSNLEHRVDADTNDEIGVLGRSFNRMTDNLKETLASRDELNQEIAQREKIEKNLRENEATLRTLINASTDDYMAFWDTSGDLTFANFHPGDELRQKALGVLEDGTHQRMEDQIGDKWFDNSFSPVYDSDGIAHGIVLFARDITEKKKTETTLTLFKAIIETSEIAVGVADPRGQLLYVNPSHEKLFGKPLAKAQTLNFRDYCPDKSIETLENEVLPSLAGSHDWEGIIDAFDARERQFPIWLHAGNLKNDKGETQFIFGLMYDYSEKQKAEMALRESEERHRSVTESSTDAIIAIDEMGRVVSWNKGAEAIFGYSEGEIMGHFLRDLMPEENREAHDAGLKRIRCGGEEKLKGKTVELKAIRKSGEEFPIELSIGSWKSGGRVFFSGIIRDITERKETERQLVQAQKIDALGNLAGGIAHDLNNMLLPILTLTGMTIKNLPEDSRDHERLVKVDQAAQRAKELVSRILSFSRNDYSSDVQSVDIHSVLCDAVRLLHPAMPTSIDIQVNLDEDTGYICADSGQIVTVLLNLSANAADALEGKMGKLDISLKKLNVGEKRAGFIQGLYKGQWAKISVKDNGHGMDEATMQKIYDPFFTTKDVGKGTGLGLSMVHGIIKKHGGVIDVRSLPDHGTTFDIYLPLKKKGECGENPLDNL